MSASVRSFSQSKSYFQGHTQEVCGLRWSSSGNFLASGGNDNIVHVWESSKMGSSKFLHRFTDHSAAVRALAWCPFQSHRLASGGGTLDQCIKIWNTQLGKCIKSTITGAQASLSLVTFAIPPVQFVDVFLLFLFRFVLWNGTDIRKRYWVLMDTIKTSWVCGHTPQCPKLQI